MSESATFPWFAVRVKLRWEKDALNSLRHKGFEALLPLYVRESQWCDRRKKLELPLFPGYIFVRFDPRRPLHVLTTPAVLSIVSFGRQLATVDSGELEAIQTVMRADVPREPWNYPNAGDVARITAGPLRGLTGVVASSDGKERLILSVTLLQRALAVEIRPQWLDIVETSTERLLQYQCAG